MRGGQYREETTGVGCEVLLEGNALTKFSDVHIPGTVSKNTSSWDVSERGATADMHCDGSRDLGWQETSTTQ